MLNVRYFAAATVAVALALISSPTFASPELAKAKNCGACHHAERKMLGPGFKMIAERYAKDEGAVKLLSEKIVKGGKGVWGATPMPPQPAVSPADAETLAKWILTLQ